MLKLGDIREISMLEKNLERFANNGNDRLSNAIFD